MNNSAKIIHSKITNVSIKFNLESTEPFSLHVTTESQISPPKKKDDKTVLFTIKATLSVPDSDILDISATAEIIFEFDEIPSDYDEVGKSLCLSKAQEFIFNKIGDIMETMGYQRFDITIPDSY